ncbi:hypothetical protein PIROE2DRAFT_57274 [Piromyces sp. E2]|nr:hypothetical protein PIROE2DRAFT_57274 [Piromyces sp. E2]|eukprot:OUM69735.1 hypothetical protein PIROE2DRAFT_57274 [Piromyces sp. E2]
MEYNYLNNNIVSNNLENDILIVDGNTLTVKETCYTLQKNVNDYNNNSDKFNFSIIGEDENYKGSFKNLNISLKTQNDNTIFYLKNDLSNDIKEIYNNETEKKAIALLKSNGFGSYRVEFLNIAKEKTEYFEMVSDKKLQICNVFYGDKDKGAPVIGKFIRKKDNCEVKLSPNIDYVFILGLASLFFCKDIYNNKDFNDGYDNIARIDMPLVTKLTNQEMSDNKIDKNNPREVEKNNDIYNKNNKELGFCAAVAAVLCCCFVRKDDDCCCCHCSDDTKEKNKK